MTNTTSWQDLIAPCFALVAGGEEHVIALPHFRELLPGQYREKFSSEVAQLRAAIGAEFEIVREAAYLRVRRSDRA